MSYLNGRLSDSVLAPIAGGKLRKDAALRWNSLNLWRRRHGKPTILPNGPDSTYRNYSRQIYWRNWWCSRGKCGNAAIPGTSNHGWGLAVDTSMAASVNATGAPFGWQKKWSDAQHEYWHFKWAGFGSVTKPRFYERVLKKGAAGSAVVRLKRLLYRAGYKPHQEKPSIWFSRQTRKQVKHFQRDHNLKADGVVGPTTWAALRRAARKSQHRRHK